MPSGRRSIRPVLILSGTVLAGVGLWRIAARPAHTSPPNILLITLDTTRADRVGVYGYKAAQTPHLDRLAQNGVLFERAVTAAPITLPAHVSLLTGTYPFVHGVRNNGNFSSSESTPTLATLLHDRGYRTAAFVSAFVLDRRYGLSRGFDVYDDRVQLERRGDLTAAAAVEWLKTTSDRSSPFFVWVHLYDPHDPYAPPAPWRERFADRPYDGEIAFDDEAMGRIVDRIGQLGLASSTLIAIVGDHGESLGDHGEATHALFVYESTLRIPLMLSWPGQLAAGTRVRSLVRGIDLAPTILDLAGQPTLPSAQGRSLAALARGTASADSEPDSAYGETYFPLLYMDWAPLRTLQDARWKFINAPTPELYDLSRDSGEETNLAVREPGRAAAMRQGLDALTGGGPGAMNERTIDRDTAARLAALGYVGAGPRTASPSPSGPKKDPKQMVGVFNAVRAANAALQDRRYAEAAASARDALTRDPGNAFATLVLANAEMEQGRYREAIAGFRTYANLVPTSADAHHRVAICYSRLGDPDRALAEDEAALAIDARFADAHLLRGGLLAARGRIDEAIRALKAAVDIDPDSATSRVGLARVLTTAGRLDEAEAELRRALTAQPDNADAHAAYGGLLVARERIDAAVAEFDRSLALRPDADDVRLDLARGLDRLGRTAAARVQFERLAQGRDTPAGIRKAARERLR